MKKFYIPDEDGAVQESTPELEPATEPTKEVAVATPTAPATVQPTVPKKSIYFTMSAKKFKEVADQWKLTYPNTKDPMEIVDLNNKSVGFVSGTVKFHTGLMPEGFIQFLLDQGELSTNQRDTLSVLVTGVSVDVDMTCSIPNHVHTMIGSLRRTAEYNAELELNGRWYPVILTSNFQVARDAGESIQYTHIHCDVKAVDWKISMSWGITKAFFFDENNDPIEMTGKEVLARMGLRFFQTDLKEYNRKLDQAQKLARQAGKVMALTGRVLYKADRSNWMYYRPFESMDLGSPEIPKKAIVEDQLETESNSNPYQAYRDSKADNTTAPLPFVRLFSFELKRYVYADLEDVASYQFDKDALKWLVLPEKEMGIISKLFRADVHKLFGDVLKDKHGGMIILANGSSGTGKTLTAEVFAEITERALYVLEMMELGVEAQNMEKNLERVFKRVTKWNAVLLMDEADIFLAKRSKKDLSRSVIVGIFLRLMDYYKGLLFMTSNRSEVIDPAFKSRITIKVEYPDHTPATRKKVWEIMLQKAGITVTDGIDGIPDVELNGRQIRNMVRLLKVLHNDQVTSDQIKEVCEFAVR